MLAWKGTRRIAVVAACLNAAGVPDFAFDRGRGHARRVRERCPL